MPWLKVYTLLAVEDEGEEIYINPSGATILDKYSYAFSNAETAGRAYNNAKDFIEALED